MGAAALALGLFFMSPTDIGCFSLVSHTEAQPAALTKSQSGALDTYNTALNQFKSILRQRRTQIEARQPLPNLPGQALYIARVNMMSAYKDLTDVLPSKIGRPNKFRIPPAYCDADSEPLSNESLALFAIMQAHPANAQKSDTPFNDVVALGTAIARAKGLNAANAQTAGRISLKNLLCRNERQSKHRQCTLKYLQGKFPDRPIRRSKWSAKMGGDQILHWPRATSARRSGSALKTSG